MRNHFNAHAFAHTHAGHGGGFHPSSGAGFNPLEGFHVPNFDSMFGGNPHTAHHMAHKFAHQNAHASAHSHASGHARAHYHAHTSGHGKNGLDSAEWIWSTLRRKHLQYRIKITRCFGKYQRSFLRTDFFGRNALWFDIDFEIEGIQLWFLTQNSLLLNPIFPLVHLFELDTSTWIKWWAFSWNWVRSFFVDTSSFRWAYV